MQYKCSVKYFSSTNIYKYVCKYVEIFSFVKLLFSNKNNNNNKKTSKIKIKEIIFALFVLKKIKFEEMKKKLLIYNYV